MPLFLEGRSTQHAYQRWLNRKATTHRKRDRARGNAEATRESYMVAIHAAVVASAGFDDYTGEPLQWELISTYSNVESKSGRRKYKKNLAYLPTVDHVADGLGPADFRICGWRTNDSKHDLTYDELVAFCEVILQHHGRIRSTHPAARLP